MPLLRVVLGSSNIPSAKDSGANLARLAVSADVEGVSGVYYEAVEAIKTSEASYDEDKQEDPWKWTLANIVVNQKESEEFELVH
jgi:hypothetical protein